MHPLCIRRVPWVISAMKLPDFFLPAVRTCGRLGLLLSCVWLVACSRPEPVAEPLRSVKVVTVGAQAGQQHIEFAAEVRPRIESRLGFRIPGKITARHVEVGQRVQSGQLLAEIDARDYRLSTEAAKAQWQAAQTQLELAQADHRRYKALREQNFISDAELERRDTALKAAQAQVDQARAQLGTQGNQVEDTRLRADRAGVVTAVEAEPGQVVAAGLPVVRVALDGPRDAVFALPEGQLPWIKPGQALTVRSWADNVQWTAKVREVAASADPVTRTFTVKVALPDQAAPALGSTATVMLERSRTPGEQGLRVPTTAVREEGKTSAVWVLETATMTVKSQSVQLGALLDNEVVVTEGLQPGQQVVVAGVHVLSPGQKVSVYKPVVDATR